MHIRFFENSSLLNCKGYFAKFTKANKSNQKRLELTERKFGCFTNFLRFTVQTEKSFRYSVSSICFFRFTNILIEEALVLLVFFPDVIGALIPTVTAAFVDAFSALRQIKKPALTHKSFAINNYI